MNRDVVNDSPAASTEQQSKTQEAAVGEEFTIKLDKTEGGPTNLGCSVDVVDGTYWVIDSIFDGLVATWNEKNWIHHREKLVKEGDHVMSVNGIRGDVRLMELAFRSSNKLEVLIRRGGLE